MKINNVDGTSDNICNCGSWLNHWKKYSGQSLPNRCPVNGCTKKPEVGAHVQKESPFNLDKSWYIVPLCNDCNAQTGGSMEIDDSIALVPANVSETCGKSRNY